MLRACRKTGMQNEKKDQVSVKSFKFGLKVKSVACINELLPSDKSKPLTKPMVNAHMSCIQTHVSAAITIKLELQHQIKIRDSTASLTMRCVSPPSA